MEGQEEPTCGNSEEYQTQSGESSGEQEEGGDDLEEMVVDGGMEDWNGFISGETALGGEEDREVVPEWRPGEPVTPQHVLCLNSYTDGE